jgi:hypothetical protein
MKYSVAVCALLGMITKEQVQALKVEDVIPEDQLVNIDEEQLKDEEYLQVVAQLNSEPVDNTFVDIEDSEDDDLVELASESLSESDEGSDGMKSGGDSQTESEEDEAEEQPKASKKGKTLVEKEKKS